jgi:hypothetical protein
MSKVICLLLLGAILAPAQRLELGATVGGGAFGAEDVGLPAFVSFGAETCVLCSGRFSIFGEYSHWEKGNTGSILRVDILAGGLRIQGKGRVRAFFDVGGAGAWDQWQGYFGDRQSHGNPGVVLAGGALIPLRGNWYIRPQVRLYALAEIHIGLAATVGFGYRFRD